MNEDWIFASLLGRNCIPNTQQWQDRPQVSGKLEAQYVTLIWPGRKCEWWYNSFQKYSLCPVGYKQPIEWWSWLNWRNNCLLFLQLIVMEGIVSIRLAYFISKCLKPIEEIHDIITSINKAWNKTFNYSKKNDEFAIVSNNLIGS